MSWVPNGPRFVFAPRKVDFLRLSRRNEEGRQSLVARIAIEPGTPGTIYAVVRPTRGNVYTPDSFDLVRSSEAGTPNEDWVSIVGGLQQDNPQLDPSWVAIDPVTPSTIYMGTWNDQSVYVSADRGTTWSAPVSLGAHIRKLVIDPRTAGSSTSTVIFAVTDQGLFRSANSGAGGTWTNVLAEDVRSFCASMPAGGPDAYYAGVFQKGLFAASDPTAPANWTNLNMARSACRLLIQRRRTSASSMPISVRSSPPASTSCF